MTPGAWAAILLVPAALSPARAATLFVPRDYPTIQAAVDDANDGDTVLVAPGTYTGDGNWDIFIREKAITLKSERGPRTSIIDCYDGSPKRHVGLVLNGSDAKPGTPVVEGFTITGARGPFAGGVYCSRGSPRITSCIIIGNASEVGGGGILCEDCTDVVIAYCVISGNMTPSPSAAALGVDRSGGGIRINGPHATLINCLITANRCTGMGGAVASGSITVVNCTISGNSASASGGIFAGSSKEHPLIVCNSIVCGNTGTDIGRPPVSHIPGDPPADCRITYSLVGATPFSKPQECPPLDQLFARLGYWDPNGTPDDPNDDFWVQGDYHLKSQAGRWDPVSETWVKDDITSPAIDAGDPDSPIGAEPFPNGGRINIGAYGGTAEASKSWFGEPVCETIIAGDINGDCRVDFQDFVLLASHWLQGTPHPAVQPYTPPAGRPPRELQPASK